MYIVTVAMTTQGRGNRSTSKFLRLEISNIIYFNIIISERENVVQLNLDVTWTSNVTCGNLNAVVILILMWWYFVVRYTEWQVWKTPDIRVLGGAACSDIKFPSRSGEFQYGPKMMDSSSCRLSVSRALHYKWYKRFSDGRVRKK